MAAYGTESRIETNEVEREARDVKIVVPDLSSSNTEDNGDENEVQSFKRASS